MYGCNFLVNNFLAMYGCNFLGCSIYKIHWRGWRSAVPHNFGWLAFYVYEELRDAYICRERGCVLRFMRNLGMAYICWDFMTSLFFIEFLIFYWVYCIDWLFRLRNLYWGVQLYFFFFCFLRFWWIEPRLIRWTIF